jgi:hypothetical protein
MSGTSPDYEYWQGFSAIQVWEIAALMHGVDPRAVGDVMIQDHEDPSNSHGVPLDTSLEKRKLISAINLRDIFSAPQDVAAPDERTEVARVTLLTWLRTKGYSELADSLETPTPVADLQSVSVTPVASTWNLKKPQRTGGYRVPLYLLLEAAHIAGNSKPSAREVIAAFTANIPTEIAKILPNGFDYYDSQGNTKEATLEALAEAIRRMTR